MKRGTWDLKHTVLLALALLLLLLRAQILYAAGLQNLAMFRLQPLWLERAEPILDPPCRASGAFSDLAQMLQPSIALGNARARTHAGRVLWLEGRCAEAITAWEQAWVGARDLGAAFELVRIGQYSVFSPDTRLSFAEGLYRRGLELLKTRGEDIANSWFSRSFDLTPRHKSADMLKNYMYKMGDTSRVRYIWQRMIESLTDSNSDYWWALAELHALNGEWSAAALAYMRAADLASYPYDYWSYIRAGEAWIRSRDDQNALLAYEKAYHLRPQWEWAYLGIGNIYSNRKQYQDAMRWYNRALQANSRSPDVYYYIAVTFYTIGDHDNARRNLEIALALQPDHQKSLDFISRWLRK